MKKLQNQQILPQGMRRVQGGTTGGDDGCIKMPGPKVKQPDIVIINGGDYNP